MLCSQELQVLLDRRLHISEGPSLTDAKSARLSARSARPHESPAWVEDVVARRKAELEELDCVEAIDKQECLMQHLKDKLASEHVHVEELAQQLEEQQLGREVDAADMLTQRRLLQDEYQEYGARKHGLAELEIEFREEHAMYQARNRSLNEWQTEFSTECAEFKAHNRGLIESQNQLQDECRAYRVHCCSLVEMQEKLRSELDEYQVRNQSLARWQLRFEQECEEFNTRSRELRECRTKWAEESAELAARNRDLAQQQNSFAEECAEFKTRNRSLTEWQSRFADEYTEYKTLNCSLAKLHQKLREPASKERDVEFNTRVYNPPMGKWQAPEIFHRDACSQTSSAEGLLRHALACNSVPLQDVRAALGHMETLLQESKHALAARELCEQREACSALVDGRGCLEEEHVQEEADGCTGSASVVPEVHEHCGDPGSRDSSAEEQVHVVTSKKAIETHLPEFEMLAPMAPPISKCADACRVVATLGVQPPSLTMEAAPAFPTVAAELPDTPRMIVKRRVHNMPSEPA